MTSPALTFEMVVCAELRLRPEPAFRQMHECLSAVRNSGRERRNSWAKDLVPFGKVGLNCYMDE